MNPKNLLLFCCIFFFFVTKAQQPLATTFRPFITTWNTAIDAGEGGGGSNDNQIFFKATGQNFTVSWVNMNNTNDTDSRTANAGDTITFATSGMYKVYITPGTGTFSALTFNPYEDEFQWFGDNNKLLSIEQWGDIKWTTFFAAFNRCENMVLNATDSPDFSNVTSVAGMFIGCSSLTTNAAMSNWNTSHIEQMNSMFGDAIAFNQPISGWDVSNVTDMSGMFENAQSFNQPIGNWNVSNVTNMNNMFSTYDYATAFNQPIGNWDVSKVTNMSYMFLGAASFNQPIGKWNVSNVTDMSYMFTAYIEAESFNQPIGNWNVSKVTNMHSMFSGADSFNQPISNWNVSKVTDMREMFGGAASFNQPIGNWNVSNVTDMDYMFAGAASFNQPIGNWNVSKVTGMSNTFYSALSFNQPIGNWNVSNVTGMNNMFYSAQSFNQPIGNWNVSKVISMESMFQGAQSFNQPLDKWNVGNVTYMDDMFNGDSIFNQPIGNWNMSKVFDMESMLQDAKSFNQPLDKWNVSSAYYTDDMFFNAHAFNQNIGSWNLSSVINMYNMFDSSGMDCNHYSQTLKGWADSTTTPKGQHLGAAGLTYDSAFAQAAHDSLTIAKGWTITGDKAGHCSVILPVNFIAFNAVQQGNVAVLNWRVADEINAKGYNVEKSANGYNYNAVGYVHADGKQSTYTFTDNNLASGNSYYRIKEVDNDGKYMYSTVRKIEYSKFIWKINGNPVNNSSVALTLDKAANISIQIISSNGNVIKTIQKGNLIAGNYNIPLNIDNINTGVYLVRLIVDDKAYLTTVVK